MPSLAPERLSDLIGSIYDCAVEPDLWPKAMADICRSIDCAASMLYLVELPGAKQRLFYTWGLTREWSSRYLGLSNDVARLWQSFPILPEIPIDQPLVLSRHPDPRSRHSRYETEWARPQQFCDSINCLVLRESKRLGVLAAARHEKVGVVTGIEIATMRLLAPHIRRAVTISDIMDLKKLEIHALGSTLDHLAAGVILVAEGQRILHANEAARAMFGAGSPVRSIGGRLSAQDADANTELLKAIDLAHRNEVEIGTTGIGVPLKAESGEPAVAHVLPLARGDLRTRLMPQPIAAVFVTSTAMRPPIGAVAVAKSFGLTPAETRFLEKLLLGTTVAEAAGALGIAETTAKTHLSRIFSKTGVARQTELALLVHRLQPPVMGAATAAQTRARVDRRG